MSDFTANNLIHNLLKQADMASQPGTVNIKKRGLQFHVFDRNRMKQRLSKLPQVVKESIERQILEFDKAFSKFPAAQNKDYSGMLRIAYAEDRLISEQTLGQLQKESPELLQTAKFVRHYGIQLPPDVEGISNNSKIDKSIGSKHWLSIFGYAYQDLGGKGLDYHVNQFKNKVPRQIQENVTGKKYPNSVNGTFQVVPAGEGFTFAIVSEGGTTYIFDSSVTSNTITMKKFFNEPIIMGRSAVYVSQDAVNYIANADATIQADPSQEQFIWGIFADPNNGAIYIQKKSRYGAGGRPSIDKETGQKVERVVGEKRFLNQQQVSFLANKQTIGKAYRVTSKNDGDFDAEEVASGYKYVYTIEDENTVQKITNPQNIQEFSFSIPALKQLRQWLQSKNTNYSFDDQGNVVNNSENSLHTSLEGFVIYMAGPDFSVGRNVEKGKTVGNPNMTQYKDLPEGEVIPFGNSLVTNRQTFVVVAKQISIPRMLASERYYETKTHQKRIILSPWREVRSNLTSLSDAVSEMKKIIVGTGGQIVEDNEGNRVTLDPLQRLQPNSRGVNKADDAFRQFVNNDKPIINNDNVDEEVKQPDIMASIANNLIRRLNSNV